MKSIILAAGYATRMYPLSYDTPKPLLPVRGKAILDWTLEDLLPLTQDCVVVTNALFATRFIAWAEKYEGKIRILNDGTDSNEKRRGAVGDLLFAVQSLQIREDVFVMGADNLLDFSLEGFLSFAREKQASCVMYGREPDREKQKKTGIITVTGESRVLPKSRRIPRRIWRYRRFIITERRISRVCRKRSAKDAVRMRRVPLPRGSAGKA